MTLKGEGGGTQQGLDKPGVSAAVHLPSAWGQPCIPPHPRGPVVNGDSSGVTVKTAEMPHGLSTATGTGNCSGRAHECL